jgi:ATP-dependent helicase HepA
VDIAKAVSEIGDFADPVRKAIGRRGDMALAPFYRTIWIDEELSAVTNPEILKALDAPYLRAPNDKGNQDWNINSERWPGVNALDMSAVRAWREWVPKARDTAKQLLRDETDLEKLCRDATERFRKLSERRFAQLQVRIQHADPYAAKEASALLTREKLIAKALYAAIREPRISLGTALAVFVSPHPVPALGSAHE